jgi:hypothetical protein
MFLISKEYVTWYLCGFLYDRGSTWVTVGVGARVGAGVAVRVGSTTTSVSVGIGLVGELLLEQAVLTMRIAMKTKEATRNFLIFPPDYDHFN